MLFLLHHNIFARVGICSAVRKYVMIKRKYHIGTVTLHCCGIFVWPRHTFADDSTAGHDRSVPRASCQTQCHDDDVNKLSNI